MILGLMIPLHNKRGKYILFFRNKKEQFHDSIFLYCHVFVLLIKLTIMICSLVYKKSTFMNKKSTVPFKICLGVLG
jgi:hypothetical protein